MLNMKSDLALHNKEYSERLISEEQKALAADEEFAHELNKYEEHVACQYKEKPERVDGNEEHSQSYSTGEASHAGDVESEHVKSTSVNEEGSTDFLAQINAAQQQSTSIQNHTDKDASVTRSQLSQVAQAIEKAKHGQAPQGVPPAEIDAEQNLNSVLMTQEKMHSSPRSDKPLIEALSKQAAGDPKEVNASDKEGAVSDDIQEKEVKTKPEARSYLDTLLGNKDKVHKDSAANQPKLAGVETNETLMGKDEKKIAIDSSNVNKASNSEQSGGKKVLLDNAEVSITAPTHSTKSAELLQKVETTLTDELGYTQLNGTDKKALQSLIRDAIESGKLSPEGTKQAELTLQAMKNLDKEKLDKATLSSEVERPAGLGSEGSIEQFKDVTKPVVKKSDVAPSPLIAAKVGDDSSRSHEVKALQEQNIKDQQIFDELIYKSENVTSKVPVSTQVEHLFKAVMQPLNPQAHLTQGQSSTGLNDFNNTIQILDSMQNQQVNINQQSATSGKMLVDPEIQQAINIARNDAAKVLQEKVSMMLNLNNKQAEIRLDPPELGSMQIRIRSDAEQAQVNFVVQNQQAKEALEQSMPKLKEMLAEQGIELGESNIQQENSGADQEQSDNNQQQGHSALANHNDEAQNSPQLVTSSSDEGSGIDYYA